jgi:hypothetical protein
VDVREVFHFDFLLLLSGGVFSCAKNPFPNLRVVKNPNDKTGTVMVTIDGKNKVLARRAIQAWPIMGRRARGVAVERFRRRSRHWRWSQRVPTLQTNS